MECFQEVWPHVRFSPKILRIGPFRKNFIELPNDHGHIGKIVPIDLHPTKYLHESFVRKGPC